MVLKPLIWDKADFFFFKQGNEQRGIKKKKKTGTHMAEKEVENLSVCVVGEKHRWIKAKNVQKGNSSENS